MAFRIANCGFEFGIAVGAMHPLDKLRKKCYNKKMLDFVRCGVDLARNGPKDGGRSPVFCSCRENARENRAPRKI
jgi:hypothetical protein